MKKEKSYYEVRFPAEALHESVIAFQDLVRRHEKDLKIEWLSVEHDDCTWSYESFEEFFADYRKYRGRARLSVSVTGFELLINVWPRAAEVCVKSPLRSDIEATFAVYEKHLKSAALPPEPKSVTPIVTPIVFIGHGRSLLWRDLKDHLTDKHGIKVEAYETGARAGHAIRGIIAELASRSSLALLVLTAEDQQSDGTFHARQNVIHETGLFQGRLGFGRAIVLLEEGTEEFSNIHGIQQIRFSKGNIKETFGEVVATIRREFGSSH